MGIFLLLLCFIAIYFTTNLYNNDNCVKNSILKTIIHISLLVLVSTEILSIFNLLNSTSLLIYWFSILLICIFILFKNKTKVKNTLLLILKSSKTYIKELSIYKKLLFFSSILLLLLTFFQGLIYPPNNWDSMTYHLPRILHWIQNESVANYPTHIERQLYQPLFSEYLILHTILLFKGDLFSNSVQFLFLALTTLAVLAVLQEFVAKTKNVIFIVFILCLTIPEALLQASSTQNDLVHSFFIICSIYFSIRCYKSLHYINFMYFGGAVGFSLLTKAIAYVYIPFILLVFAIFILIKIIKEKKPIVFAYGFSIIITIALINIGHSYRNFQITNNILGTTPEITKGIVFEKTSPKIIISSCIKNAALHSDSYFVGDLGNVISEKAHVLMNFNINEPGTNVFDMKFNATNFWKNHEDTQPNFIQFLLFIFCTLLFVYTILKTKKINKIALSFLLLISFQFILFSAYLCWEPWNTRLHLPLFFEMIIFIGIVFNELQEKFYSTLMGILMPIMILYGFHVTLNNFSRPFITTKNKTSAIKINDSRYKKYFANELKMYPDYRSLQQYLSVTKKNDMGFFSHNDGWEYPIIMNSFRRSNLKIHHLNLKNSTTKIEEINKNLDCIVSTYNTGDTIYYNKEKFKLTSKKNKTLFIYKKI